ncbi:NADH-quinone oxidoreductase subunit A [Limisalsivibrio acetivorans]|uniref:NADH-quinone oxidoreductase subunit A n=1 Tax=Limisalsivibrio acetivorans TaxID=1304888 RepID=UPI0003B4519C|nr:NADH-quinone oxidoreductase subunit A [Limisalsivibrio acetivorans]
MNEYLPVALMFLIAGLIGAVTMVVGGIVRPRKYGKVKNSVYECGMPEFSDARKRYNVRFYIIAMLFVIFDVETVFLFPWAVSFDMIGLYGLIEMILFLVILIFGYFYAWRKGALEWV